MKILCYVPDQCIDQSRPIAAQVRQQLVAALDSDLSPLPLPRGCPSQAIDLDEELHRRLDDVAKHQGVVIGRAAGGLLLALQQGIPRHQQGQTAPEPHLEGLRRDQARCVAEAAPLLQAGRIVVSECGTGSGKSRLIAHLASFVLNLRDQGHLPAIQTLEKDDSPAPFMFDVANKAMDRLKARLEEGRAPSQPVIVAAPSIATLAHLANEWNAVRGVLDPDNKVRVAIVLGRPQFVSRARILEFLEVFPNATHVQEWVKAGMPAGRSASTKSMAQLVPSLYGLMEDLVHAAEMDPDGFPYRECELDEDDPEDEQLCYQSVKASAFQCDLLMTSHAMLAMDTRLLTAEDRKPILPPPAAVFVDEAHLLENAQADEAAKALSFLRLRQALQLTWSGQRRSLATKAVSTLARISQVMADIPDGTFLPIDHNSDPRVQAAWRLAQSDLRSLGENLAAMVKVKSRGSTEAAGDDGDSRQRRALRYVQRSAMAIDAALESKRGFVHQSRVKGLTSLTVGPSNVGHLLLARWATTPCAMLLSGTILYRRSNGPTAEFFLRENSIPLSRGVQTIPIHPAWITNTPVLMIPSTEASKALTPPSSDQPEEFVAWCDACASVVLRAASTAKGGTLVTCTSYERVEGIAAALVLLPDIQARLIVQKRGQAVAALAAQFKSMARAGIRPVWLATGSANVGIDLADEEVTERNSHRDMLLTDLVIPNVPYGVERSTVHLARAARVGFIAEMIGTQRRFLQMIGRLVRREGLRDRRLWVLDGRLFAKFPMSHSTDLRGVLLPYIHTQRFSLR
jgi:ATP-dependent DNA helicase DinG